MCRYVGAFVETVYAYRDDGWMADLTRWKPRRVHCTQRPDHSDRPGVLHAVKYRQGKEGTAALISEVLCNKLLRAGGVLVLDARLVHVSPEFAASYVTKTEIPYTINVGLHFGTVLRGDVGDGPPPSINTVADPRDILDIWAFDSWLCNTDRNTHGNLLLALDRSGKFRLIAADQSDCFGGAGRLADGGWQTRLAGSNRAETVDFWDAAILQAGGASALRDSVEKVRRAWGVIDEAIGAVPPGWWNCASVDASLIKRALDDRLRRLPDILNIEQWEGLNNEFRQGRLL